MQSKVKAGISTVSLGGVSVVAYVLAVLAFIDGQRDETTISLVATGTVALVTMAAGRFWQAVEKIRAERRTPTAGVTAAGLLAQAGSGTHLVAKYDTPFSTGAQMKTPEAPPMGYTRSGGLGAGVLDNDDDHDHDLDPDPPSGRDSTLDNPELDDPEHTPPTREQHSGLRG